jgi:hypothetical protein
MQVTIHVPTKAQILAGGFQIKTAGATDSWSKSQLGHYAGSRGVHVHHSNGRILYVGKTTTGAFGTFGERLRREFQQKAAQNSSLHQLLCNQKKPIRTYCLDLDDLDMMVDQGPMQLSQERKALIMEQVLIGIYSPKGNLV